MATPRDTSITSIDDEPKAVVVAKAKNIAVANTGDHMSGEKMEVTIHQGEGELGRQAVFLGINGEGTLVPRGVPCKLPVELVEILDNATMTVYEPTTNGQTIEREVKRYSYTAKAIKA
jgi:hypothetical protein